VQNGSQTPPAKSRNFAKRFISMGHCQKPCLINLSLLKGKVGPGKTNKRGKLSTVDLLIKTGGFLKSK
jgi:hypothetical protein